MCHVVKGPSAEAGIAGGGNVGGDEAERLGREHISVQTLRHPVLYSFVISGLARNRSAGTGGSGDDE